MMGYWGQWPLWGYVLWGFWVLPGKCRGAHTAAGQTRWPIPSGRWVMGCEQLSLLECCEFEPMPGWGSPHLCQLLIQSQHGSLIVSTVTEGLVVGQMGSLTCVESTCLALDVGPAVGAAVGTSPRGWEHLPPAGGRRDGDDGDPRLFFFLILPLPTRSASSASRGNGGAAPFPGRAGQHLHLGR